MATECFSVKLETPGGQELPSVAWNGDEWFVGEPGQEFQVALSRSTNTSKVFRVCLKVDGQCPGYSQYSRPHTRSGKVVSQGWLKNGNDPHERVYQRFKFSSFTPSQDAPTAASADDIPVGRIEVELCEVVDTGRLKRRSLGASAGPSRDPQPKLAEGKKWFMAPGLKAEAGTPGTSSRSGRKKRVYQEVATLPSLHVRYDSSEALYLRKALNPRFGPHRAILRRSANPALGAEPAAAAAAAAAAGGAGSSRQQDATGRVKREAAGVKREREDGQGEEEYVPRSATAADRVDLTEEPVRPMTVNGRQLAPDELAVCDLCDSDDEGAGAAAAAPRWQVKKKHQIEVTEM